jgi:hypothetical protein
MLSKASRLRTAAVAGLAALSLGGVAAAAASGLAPVAAGRSAQAPPNTSSARAAAAHGQAATLVHGRDAAAAASGSSGRSSDHATGPDASGPARHGLCTAWLAGQGDANGQRADAPAFQALAAAAGGADQVAAYCQADAAGSPAHGRRPVTPPNGQGKSTPPTTGPPASPGNGHGQGGPPTTTG